MVSLISCRNGLFKMTKAGKNLEHQKLNVEMSNVEV